MHKAGAHVWFHSDGYIMDIIPDFIEIGVDVLNLNQLNLNGIDEIGERFGGKVCFFGGLDQQRILPFGSVEEVERHVKHIIQTLAGYEGGYIAVAPLWDIMVVYGPEAIMRTPAGAAPCSVWARITDNLESFCEECAKLWFGGAKTIRIRRLEELNKERRVAI
ncbi:MAG: DUF3830 family protein [Chloroflexi bacterium]|nr:DUF3830 family protein [Chloroflexota bacterium]